MQGTPLHLLLVSLLAVASPALRADIYGFVDERGVPSFSDLPTDPRARLLWRDLKGPKAIGIPDSSALMHSLPAALDQHIEHVARQHDIYPLLLKTVVAV